MYEERGSDGLFVDVDPAEVWAVLVDHDRWPTWFRGIARARGTSTPAAWKAVSSPKAM